MRDYSISQCESSRKTLPHVAAINCSYKTLPECITKTIRKTQQRHTRSSCSEICNTVNYITKIHKISKD